MVYRGRPSTGCKKCRERKIKCDERLDGCVKCAERGFSCPGYDRNIDTWFHNETANVQAKAKKSKARSLASRGGRQARNPRAVPVLMAPGSPGMQISNSIIDQGISYFMAYYSSGTDQPPLNSEAYNRHLSTHGFHPLVATSMAALGIAGMANLYMDFQLKREAMRWYLNAIKMANSAISCPKSVKSDSTLTSIILLGTFEATFNDRSLAAWSNHVDGAASLIKLRGMDQFSTNAGQRMYLHTISLFTMNCMGKGVPLPQFVHDMNKHVMTHFHIDDPRSQFFLLHIQTIDLRARILSQELVALDEIIQAALELDTIAMKIFKDKGPQWTYDTVFCEDHPRIFGSFYHVYPTATTAQTWNWIRYNRIYFHDIIRNCILAGFAISPMTFVDIEYHNQLEASTQTLQQLQSDILASMPQFMHDVPMTVPPKANEQNKPMPTPHVTPGASTSQSSSSSRNGSSNPHKSFVHNFRNNLVPIAHSQNGHLPVVDKLPIVRTAGGYATNWGLYVAGAMPTASPESQDFVYTCLTRIEQEFGIKQAKILATALQRKRQLASKGVLPFSIVQNYLPPDHDP